MIIFVLIASVIAFALTNVFAKKMWQTLLSLVFGLLFVLSLGLIVENITNHFGMEEVTETKTTPLVSSADQSDVNMLLYQSEGAEVLIHMGIDTVQMAQPAFEVSVKEGQEVTPGMPIARMDLAKVKEQGKDTTIMVVFTDDKVKEIAITTLGSVEMGTEIGKIKL